jgi:hypothetical protein
VTKQLRSQLQQHSINIQPASNTFILCEGKAFPFHDIISMVQKLEPGQNALIHASSSKSIVGSWDKNQQGLTLEVGR